MHKRSWSPLDITLTGEFQRDTFDPFKRNSNEDSSRRSRGSASRREVTGRVGLETSGTVVNPGARRHLP